MRRTALPTVLVALLLPLAGCLGQDDPAGATPAGGSVADANMTTDVVNDDGSKPSVAMDLGHMPHIHDYWKGKERVTLFDGDLEPDALNATFATFVQVFLFREPVAGGMQFYLPDGSIVYEGTGQMEFTASWSDPRVTGIGFVYIAPDSREFREGGSLPNGQTFTLPITPKMTDMPHAKSSRWWFGFGPDESPGTLLGKFHLKIDIVKVNDIMTFPGHPDFWQGAHEIVRLDTDHKGDQVSYAKRVTQPLTQGNFTEDEVQLEKPVPMETKAVRFVVNVSAVSSTPGQVTSLGFFYIGANAANNYYRCEVKELKSVPATLEWTVMSTMEMTDSPYEEGSLWRFLVEPHVTLTGADPESGGMTDTSITYHVVATALDYEPGEMSTCKLNGAGGR